MKLKFESSPCTICCSSPTLKKKKSGIEKAWSELADAIFCICLQERPDRFALACAEAHRWGLCRQIRFYRPTKPAAADADKRGIKYRGFWGSWESHRTIAQYARANQLKRVLILEDDFHFLPQYTTPTRITEIANDIKILDRQNPDWDLFFLGEMPFCGFPVIGGRVFRTWGCWVHAYILSEAGQRLLVSHPYLSNGIEQTLDTWLRQKATTYATFPMLAVQSAVVGSDNLPATHDIYTRLIEWWTMFHKHHSLGIEISAFILLPIVILFTILLLLSLARALR